MCSSDICSARPRARADRRVTMRTPRSCAHVQVLLRLPVPKVPSAGLQPHRIMSFELT